MMELVPGTLDVADVQHTADAIAGTAAASGAAQLRSRGFKADGVSLEGDPKSVIVDRAKEWSADLIVAGSCNRPRLERFFVGSVSQAVTAHAPCPVLVIKPKQPDEA